MKREEPHHSTCHILSVVSEVAGDERKGRTRLPHCLRVVHAKVAQKIEEEATFMDVLCIGSLAWVSSISQFAGEEVSMAL